MDSVTTNNKRIAKNTLYLYIRLLFAMAVGLYTSRIILAALGNEDYGLYSVVGSIVVIFYFLNTSMAGATSRFLTFELGKGNSDKLKKTFSAALTIHIFIAIVILLLGETIGLWYLENKMIIPEGRLTAARWVYQLSLLGAIITITQVPYSATIIAHEKMNIYAYIEITKTVLQLIIAFPLIIWNSDKLILYSILTTCVSIVITILYRWYCIMHYPECKYKYHLDKKLIKPMMSFSGWNLYTDFAYQAQNNGINIILNLFFGTIVNAAYSIGLQLSRVVYSFISSFTLAVKPQIIKYYSIGQIKEMESLMNSATKYSFLLLYTLALPVIMNTDFILKLWLKQPPEYSITYCRLFLIMMMLNILWINLTYATQATNKIKIASIITGTLYILIPIISYIIFKFYIEMIYIPMYIAIVIYIFVIAARLYIVKKLIPQISISKYCIKVILLSIFTCIIGSVIPVIVYFCINSDWPQLIFTCIASVISMTLSTYYFATEKSFRQKIIIYILNKLHIHMA